MSRTITSEYRLDEQLASMRAHTIRQFEGKRGVHFVLTFALIIFALVFVSVITSDGERSLSTALVGGPIVGIAAGVLVLVLCRTILPRICGRPVRKAFRDLKLEGKHCTYILDDNGVTLEDSNWGGQFDWDDLVDWYENQQFLMIYRTDHFFYYFSKAQVAEDDLSFVREQLVRVSANRA